MMAFNTKMTSDKRIHHQLISLTSSKFLNGPNGSFQPDPATPHSLIGETVEPPKASLARLD